MPVNRTGACSRRDLRETLLIIFPLIIIGSALGIVRFRGRYLSSVYLSSALAAARKKRRPSEKRRARAACIPAPPTAAVISPFCHTCPDDEKPGFPFGKAG